MSAPFVIPFNFQPDSVSVKTGSYTIPPAKYARVVVNLIGSATFTIDAVTALSGAQNSTITSAGNLYKMAGNPGTVSSNQVGTLGTAGFSGGSSTTSTEAVFGNETDQKVVVAEYWLPTGTIINGTGTWRAVVMIYNQIF